MSTRRMLAAALALVALAPAGCSDDGPGEGEARLEVDGQALVEREDGAREDVDDSTELGPGDRVEVLEGTATMALRDGTRFELRSGVADAAPSRLRMAAVPVLEAGDLLVSAPESAVIEADDTQVAVREGAAQVSRAFGMSVAAYDGSVQLDSAGQERMVPALRQMQVPTLGSPPRAPRPVAYDAEDPWDRRFLGAAIELGERLESVARGYTSNLPEGEGRTPGFFRLVLPGLEDESEFGAELLDLDRPPGDTLVGAAITDLGREGDFVSRWEAVFEFKDQGAHWGLVTLDQDVSGTPLLGAIEEALGLSPLGFGEVTAPPPPAPAPAPTPTPGGQTSTTTRPPPTSGPPVTNPPPPTTPPPPGSPVEPLDPVLEPVLPPVLEPVTGLVPGLVNGLLGLLGQPAPG